MASASSGQPAWRTPSLLWCWCAVLVAVDTAKQHQQQHRSVNGDKEDLSLYIDEQQVKMYSGISMPIYAIRDGEVMSYILDKNFEQYLPVIPSEVGYVNFTWMSGKKKYFYVFDSLRSFDESILKPPIVTIEPKGRIPSEPKVFSILLPCTGNVGGNTSFSISLSIHNRKLRALPFTPLKVKLKKNCTVNSASKSTSPDLECDKKCENNGRCNADKICQCQDGYMGQYCKTALCYPQCMNNGTCIAPGRCKCLPGYQGPNCEGGICAEKCLNGGKCIQKDTCQCRKGFYGPRCEKTKCIIPCLNGGKCKGINKCRCPFGFQGDHCEIGQPVQQYYDCKRPCHNGYCTENKTCRCQQGWAGKFCTRKVLKPKRNNTLKLRYSPSIEDDYDPEDDYEEVTKKRRKVFKC
ncbi:protein shifted-like [Adelges cooleyi]|uniref:protein shifted-like n=1 Tax=Adelges cooleyi TaxID=133065 RepID=UPI00217FD0F2|nr:protein shifted-like [Adelges cooleyi]